MMKLRSGGQEKDGSEMILAYNEIQAKLRSKVDLCTHFDIGKVRLVAGVDLAYWKENHEEKAVCSIIIYDMAKKETVEAQSIQGEITVPYLPGYLSFRELPLIIEAYGLLQTKPDIVMFDGNGFLHNRNMGIATHASFSLNVPTIGVAKSYLKIEGTEFEMPINEAGAFTDIIVNGVTYGRALRTQRDVKPVFVSCGNWIDLETTTRLVMSLLNSESHLPIPVRLADIESKVKRREILAQE